MNPADLRITVGTGSQIPMESSTSGQPASIPLASVPTRGSQSDLTTNGSKAEDAAPKRSVLQSIGKHTVKQLTGFKPSEISERFETAWAKDKQKGVLGKLKMAGRVLGFSLGVVINVTSRVVAFAAAIGVGILAGLYQFIRHPINSFKDPHNVMTNTLAAGIIGGVIAGGVVGTLGVKLVKLSLDIHTGQSSFQQSMEDNMIPAAAGMFIGGAATCLYPAMWQLPFRKDNSIDISPDEFLQMFSKTDESIDPGKQTI
jgi:hypothetical protein